MDGLLLRAPEAAGDIVALLAEHAASVDQEASFPWASIEALQAEGVLGLTARRSDGGQEAGLVEAAALVREAGRGCASSALILAMQLIHVRAAWRGSWPEKLAARVGRSAVGCGALINALRVEPALGTPARGGLPATAARRVAQGWSINGRKIYSTGAPGLSWMIVFARTDEAEPRVGQFLVPARTQGIQIEPTWDQLGLRGSGSHDVVLDGVVVPEDHAVDLRAPREWAQPDPDGAAWNGLLIAALYTGVAEAARDWTAGFLRSRVPSNLGAPLATLPRMQEAMGRIEARVLTSRRLIESAAAETDADRPPDPAESGLIKTIAAENAIASVQACLELAGNHGLSRANPLERHLRDVLCARVHTPQPDAAYTTAGRLILET
ncbi:MAG TPA: acyl-CoA dehydrogenase family protein [Acetobacteraceae bacterium]|nr:acyl-CoA dehydrogenase family protein [Acetobacteraceae bacterium]